MTLRGAWALATQVQILAHQRKRIAALGAEWRVIARAMGVPVYVDASRN